MISILLFDSLSKDMSTGMLVYSFCFILTEIAKLQKSEVSLQRSFHISKFSVYPSDNSAVDKRFADCRALSDVLYNSHVLYN